MCFGNVAATSFSLLITQAQTMDSDDKNVHGLPFKVVSTCYSPSRQKTLEASYDYI